MDHSHGGTSSTSNTSSMGAAAQLSTYLKRRLRALLHDQYHQQKAPSSSRRGAGAGSRRPWSVLAGWGLLALAGLVLVVNVFESQGLLFMSSGGRGDAGLRASGGTQGGTLLPRRAVNQVLYDCGGSVPGGGGCSSAGLLILQTSDGRGGYARMLDATQGVQLAYAQQWGFSYLRWDGLAKGRQAWHATYNRIYLLSELFRLRHQHRYRWVLFMDPDAIIVDPTLSVEDLLDERYAVIGCRGGEDPALWWDVNIGVAFFNLRHPDFGGIVSRWLWRIRWVPEARMEEGSTDTYVAMGAGPKGVRDDQQMFHQLMSQHPRGPALVKRYMGGDSALFNYGDGKYVAHLIRADNKDQEARLAELLQRKALFFRRLAVLEAERAEVAARALERRRERKRQEEGEERAEEAGGGGDGGGSGASV